MAPKASRGWDMGSTATDIFELARALAAETPGFDDRRGPGKDAGDGVTRRFVEQLDVRVGARFNAAVQRQRRIPGKARFTFDYYLPVERSAVEIALSLRNPLSEFEKDVFKAILANDGGLPVEQLLLIGKRGAATGSVRRGQRPSLNGSRSTAG